MEIQELKNFIGISKNKTTYKLIQELKACITKINNKTNLEIEFKLNQLQCIGNKVHIFLFAGKKIVLLCG
jgi:hypothetical protein